MKIYSRNFVFSVVKILTLVNVHFLSKMMACKFTISTSFTQLQTDTAEDGSLVYTFNGSPDSFVGIPQELNFQPSQGFTFTVWLQQEAGNTG